jgi:hypothetical protein
VTRHAELPHRENVERDAERLGHFVGYGHATARERQYDHVRTVGVCGELLCE